MANQQSKPLSQEGPCTELTQRQILFVAFRSLHFHYFAINNLSGVYLLKVNKRNNRTRCQIRSKLQ